MTSAKLSLFPPPQKNPGSWLVLEETEATGGGEGPYLLKKEEWKSLDRNIQKENPSEQIITKGPNTTSNPRWGKTSTPTPPW